MSKALDNIAYKLNARYGVLEGSKVTWNSSKIFKNEFTRASFSGTKCWAIGIMDGPENRRVRASFKMSITEVSKSDMSSAVIEYL